MRVALFTFGLAFGFSAGIHFAQWVTHWDKLGCDE